MLVVVVVAFVAFVVVVVLFVVVLFYGCSVVGRIVCGVVVAWGRSAAHVVADFVAEFQSVGCSFVVGDWGEIALKLV